MKLKEILEICYGKNQREVEVDFSSIPILGTGGIIGYASRPLYDGESVLIGRKGTIGMPFYINKPFWTIDTLFYTKINKSIVLPKYLYYCLMTIGLERYSEGAAVPSLTTKTLYDIEIDVPSMEIQQHIVNTIGSIDDLIENKYALIAKIKEFRRVAFLNWKSASKHEESLSDFVSFENGAQPPKEQHIYEPAEGYVRFVQNRDYDSDSHLTYIPISKRNHLCNELDIMMDKYGEAGAVRYGIAGAYNVALLKIIPTKPNMKEWVRDFLSQPEIKDILYLSSQASTRPSLNESTFIALKIPMLDKDQFDKYENQMKTLLCEELLIKKEIIKLKEAKNRLLEKYF